LAAILACCVECGEHQAVLIGEIGQVFQVLSRFDREPGPGKN
jgi:hypothetical protein